MSSIGRKIKNIQTQINFLKSDRGAIPGEWDAEIARLEKNLKKLEKKRRIGWDPRMGDYPPGGEKAGYGWRKGHEPGRKRKKKPWWHIF